MNELQDADLRIGGADVNDVISGHDAQQAARIWRKFEGEETRPTRKHKVVLGVLLSALGFRILPLSKPTRVCFQIPTEVLRIRQ